jgi:hypothetical protein
VTDSLLTAVRSGLTRNHVMTAPDSHDPRLRGRTYAIPFEAVWQASLRLAHGELRGWSVLDDDDQEGTIRAVVRGRIARLESEVTVRISLDVDAQTRVDASAGSPAVRGDLGVNARRLGRFFRRLDALIEADRPGGRLEPAPSQGASTSH